MAAFSPAAQSVEDQIGGVRQEFENALRNVLAMYPTSDEVLRATPGRVIRALQEMTKGYDRDPAEILACQFPESCRDLALIRNVEFVSLCEHHLMPFVGHAHVGYLPDGKVVGLSKLPRLVQCFAQRLQLQERMTNEIASALLEHVSAKGAACVIEATHGCLSCRGALQKQAVFVTSAMLGAFRESGDLRREFFASIQLNSRI